MKYVSNVSDIQSDSKLNLFVYENESNERRVLSSKIILTRIYIYEILKFFIFLYTTFHLLLLMIINLFILLYFFFLQQI